MLSEYLKKLKAQKTGIQPKQNKLSLAEAKKLLSSKKTYQQLTKKQYRTKGKYNNQTQTYNGRRYDSIREANHAEELDWRIKAKEIKEVIPQYKIDLRVNGQHVTNYYVDFKVIMADGSVQFQEVKGFATDVWKLKWRLFEVLVNEIEPGAELLVIK